VNKYLVGPIDGRTLIYSRRQKTTTIVKATESMDISGSVCRLDWLGRNNTAWNRRDRSGQWRSYELCQDVKLLLVLLQSSNVQDKHPPCAVRLSWLKMPIRAHFFSAANFDPQNRSDWPTFWCAIRVH